MSKFVVQCGWNDVPHLSEDEKADLLASTPPYLRKARSEGLPSLGAGAIFPIPEEDIICKPFKIPPHWVRGYGMDVGWNRTAALWMAEDRDTGMRYLYREHYRGQAEPVIHAAAIQRPYPWIPGAIDVAARGRGQRDGEQLLQNYWDLGLKLTEAKSTPEATLYELWEAFSIGRLRVFEHLAAFRAEYRLYRRDKNGQIVKENDHLMDALRYIWSLFAMIAVAMPFKDHLGPKVAPYAPIDPIAGV